MNNYYYFFYAVIKIVIKCQSLTIALAGEPGPVDHSGTQRPPPGEDLWVDGTNHRIYEASSPHTRTRSGALISSLPLPVP